jgi:hypothetical protein
MMRETRLRLLKIPSVVAVRCGQAVDRECEWPFFVAVVLETSDKLSAFAADPVWKCYLDEAILPNTTGRIVLDFKTVPGGDPLYC